MNCLDFERLLDVGDPANLPADALVHARGCARCERAWARARSLELALTRHFAAGLTGSVASGDGVLEGFADRVLARVERGEARGVRWLALPDALPWWVRVPAEPSAVLAATVAALLLWRGDALVTTMRAWFPVVALVPTRLVDGVNALGLAVPLQSVAQAFVPGPQADWSVVAAMAIGVTPVLALAGYGLWRLTERLVAPTDTLTSGSRHA